MAAHNRANTGGTLDGTRAPLCVGTGDHASFLAERTAGLWHPLTRLLGLLENQWGVLARQRATELLGNDIRDLLALHPALHMTLEEMWDINHQCFRQDVHVKKLIDTLTLCQILREQDSKFAGEGANGTVYLSSDLVHKKRIAVKVITNVLGANGISRHVLQEFHVLNVLPSHPNIIKVHSTSIIGDKAYLVMPPMETDLKQHLWKYGRMPKSIAQRIVFNILCALAHMHEHGFVHGDVKPANVLMCQNCSNVQLGDFGLSFWDNCQPATHQMQSPLYRAIEVCDSLSKPPSGGAQGEDDEFDPVGPEMDVWSVGAVFVELLNGKALLADARQAPVNEQALQNQYLAEEIVSHLGCHERYANVYGQHTPLVLDGRTPMHHLARLVPAIAHDAAALDLLAGLLDQGVETRITAQAAVCHPCFAGLKGRPDRAGEAVRTVGKRTVMKCIADGTGSCLREQCLEPSKRRRVACGTDKHCAFGATAAAL